MPEITNGNLCQVQWVTGTLYIWPMNSEAKDVLDAVFAADGALTTVAITQADAVRSGYADTSTPYQGLKLALS